MKPNTVTRRKKKFIVVILKREAIREFTKNLPNIFSRCFQLKMAYCIKKQRALSLAAQETRFLTLRFNFFLGCVMNENFVSGTRCIEAGSLAPIVTTCISKEISLGIEIGTCDGALNSIESLQPLFIVLIPKIDLQQKDFPFRHIKYEIVTSRKIP